MDTLGEIATLGAARFGPRIALLEAAGGLTLSYEQLEQQSCALSNELQRQGLIRGAVVGLCLEKTAATVTAIFAILRAEAAYVPVDPSSSAHRNASIFESSQPWAILLESDRIEVLYAALPCQVRHLELEISGFSLLLCQWDRCEAPAYAPDLAMILYTSGSTGKPKGVQLSHGNARTFIDWCQETFDVGEDDVCSSIAPFYFDLSIFDLYVSLSAGATVLLLDQRTCQNPRLVARHFQEHRVSTCYATPTMLKLLLFHGQLDKLDHSSLRIVLFAGEIFPIRPLRQLMASWNSARFYNLYGPTETNVVTYFSLPMQIEEGREKPFPIGAPCNYARCAILIGGQPTSLSPGLSGELLVSGPSVTAGYLDDEAKNRAAFIQYECVNYYRTGDLVSITAEGDLVFQQRLDRMVKRRGYRIELDEIEIALSHLERVLDAAVCSRREGDEVFIDAYLVQDPAQDAAPPSVLKRHCLQYLPAYFLPDRYINLAELPRTGSGKTDYNRLAGHEP